MNPHALLPRVSLVQMSNAALADLAAAIAGLLASRKADEETIWDESGFTAGCGAGLLKERTMGDDLNNPGPEDGRTISLTEEHELDYWTKRLGVTRQRLREAVDNAGHGAAAVRAWLGAHPQAPAEDTGVGDREPTGGDPPEGADL